ncbi:NADPH-dependent F420 reductase [Neomicrococcus lactis]|uniref:NADPH-dependent F420 reductase n=1 Tax=Neomicrococcus lactis TaxID=732241 RepID=UPI002301F65F|nr:NAD(P)-binding domain-containing protein [Neomicrococcus lactis]
MADVTIIGAGNMARGIGSRVVAADRSLEILTRDASKAEALAAELGGAVSGAALDQKVSGKIVVLALPFDAAQEVVKSLGSALDGKIVIDISNPVNFETFDSLTVPAGTSAAEELAKLAPNATFVKAFNTVFAGNFASGKINGQPLDVFIAADSAEARSAVVSLVDDADMRAIEVGGLHHARELEGFQLLHMALQVNPAYENFQWGSAIQIAG